MRPFPTPHALPRKFRGAIDEPLAIDYLTTQTNACVRVKTDPRHQGVPLARQGRPDKAESEWTLRLMVTTGDLDPR